MSSINTAWQRIVPKRIWAMGLVVFVLIFAACQSTPPAAEPVEEEPAAAEATATPEEEAEAEATAPAEEEAEATAPAEEEAEATAPAEEEAEATAPAEEEATAEPEEEPAAEGTAVPEEEAATEGAALLGDPAHGEYIATLTGGCGCHFNRELGALAGGNEFEGPFGVAYARNITSDEATGIGAWGEQDIATALRTGARPDGTQLVPVMPYRRFSVLSDQEALDVAAYLLSLEPVANEVPARELTSDPEPFTPDPAPPAEPPSDPVARGEQLVTIANCSGCHTPLGEDGSPNMDLFLAGGPLPDDEISANITPDEETGIGAWSEEEIANLLRTGAYPDGSSVGGSMGQQIERRFSLLTEEDALAIAAYLKSIPPISHDPAAQ
jgi:mono/diheme cytochrome c family protein